MNYSSAKEAITLAYTATGLGRSLDTDGQDTGSVVSSHVCPFCKKPNTSKAIEPTDEHPKDRFACKSCGERYPKPLVRKVRGSINMASSVSRGPSDWRIVEGVEKGLVQNVVESLPGAQGAWVMYAYTDKSTSNDEAILLDYIVNGMDDGGAGKPRNWHHAKKVLCLVAMLMEHIRQQEMNGTKRYSKPQLAAAIGVDVGGFQPRKHWGRIYEAINLCLGALNANALSPVEDCLRLVSGKKSA